MKVLRMLRGTTPAPIRTGVVLGLHPNQDQTCSRKEIQYLRFAGHHPADCEMAMALVARIQGLLGGEANTGPLHTERDIMQLVRRGVPTSAVDHFLRASGLSFNSLDPQILNRRTFKRRQENAQPLDAAESDRLMRVVGVVASAEETFGDPVKAHIWLSRENRVLGGETPLGMMDTDQGTRTVEALLGRIAHGLAA